MIPGYPSLSPAQVAQFQRNNGLKPDGDAGPKTRSRIWIEAGSKRYTYLAPYDVRNGGAVESRAFALAELDKLEKARRLPLSAERCAVITGLLLSDWETGFDFLSTQDGITFGGRRLAARTLRRFVTQRVRLFAPHLGAWGMLAASKIEDAPNNGAPLDDPAVRLAFIAAASDREIWHAQLEEIVDEIVEVLSEHSWLRTGREICLAMRIHNSGSALVARYERKHGASYDGLVEGYTTRGGRGSARVKRIEKLVPASEVWRA